MLFRSGVLAGDNVALSTTGATIGFADANVAAGKTVTATGLSLSGSEAANYILTGAVPALAADITVRTLTLTNVAVATRDYDGTAGATLAPTATLVGMLPTATVLLNDAGATASFLDKNAGSGKPVTVSGYTLEIGRAHV